MRFGLGWRSRYHIDGGNISLTDRRYFWRSGIICTAALSGLSAIAAAEERKDGGKQDQNVMNIIHRFSANDLYKRVQSRKCRAETHPKNRHPYDRYQPSSRYNNAALPSASAATGIAHAARMTAGADWRPTPLRHCRARIPCCRAESRDDNCHNTAPAAHPQRKRRRKEHHRAEQDRLDNKPLKLQLMARRAAGRSLSRRE